MGMGRAERTTIVRRAMGSGDIRDTANDLTFFGFRMAHNGSGEDTSQEEAARQVGITFTAAEAANLYSGRGGSYDRKQRTYGWP